MFLGFLFNISSELLCNCNLPDDNERGRSRSITGMLRILSNHNVAANCHGKLPSLFCHTIIIHGRNSNIDAPLMFMRYK